MEVANKPARDFPTQVLILLLCLKDNQKVLTLGELMTEGQFQVQEKPPADLDDAISSLVTKKACVIPELIINMRPAAAAAESNYGILQP